MSPMVVYASKLVSLAVVSAGLLGEAIARMVVFGVTADTLIPASAGGLGLLIIAVKLWKDEAFARQQRDFYEEKARFEYTRGVSEGRQGKTVHEAIAEVAPTPVERLPE